MKNRLRVKPLCCSIHEVLGDTIHHTNLKLKENCCNLQKGDIENILCVIYVPGFLTLFWQQKLTGFFALSYWPGCQNKCQAVNHFQITPSHFANVSKYTLDRSKFQLRKKRPNNWRKQETQSNCGPFFALSYFHKSSPSRSICLC